MELLTYPKTEYLLDASLESLHAESLTWLSEISFWTDEMAFYYKLLHKKELVETCPPLDLAFLEKDLIKIYGEKLDKVRLEIKSHERALASVIKSTSLQEEENFREAHRRLLMEIYEIQMLIRIFKKRVFEFIKK
ncbi:hypothetical protein [Chryseolinea sp. H1M3-3]|uniref:hypothetical protein n=1 Tax=Chryseolinea sp. H1M3-3 TaxID=3034144 RepID=UPI0023ED799C|nr:hypothetical protein [Chryseolinea sp. H1M3-3]